MIKILLLIFYYFYNNKLIHPIYTLPVPNYNGTTWVVLCASAKNWKSYAIQVNIINSLLKSL